MISSVTKQFGASTETFKMGNRAMRALETRFDRGIPSLVEWMQNDKDSKVINILTAMVAESAANGAGKDMAFADELIDGIGQAATQELVNEIVEAAFPDAKEEPAKNAQGAGQAA